MGRRARGQEAAEALFDSLPEASRKEGQRLIAELASDALAAQQRDVAVYTGYLKSALSIDAQLAAFRARVGLVGPKAGGAWYGRIVDGGRQAQTVRYRRRRSGGKVNLQAEFRTMRVSALPARPFINAARPELDSQIDQRVSDFWSRVMADAGGAA